MKLFFKIINCTLISFLLFSSCQNNLAEGEGVAIGTEVALHIKMKVPPTNKYKTRAVEENVINNIDILVFEKTGAEYEYVYMVTGYSLTANENEDDIYDFKARILASDNPLKLYFLANVGRIPTLSEGASEEEVKAALTGSFTNPGFTTYLPMSGEKEFPSGITTDNTRIDDLTMIRSVARIDIENTAANFTLTSVYAYRANNLYQIIPNSISNNRVTEPSIPADAIRNVTIGPFDVNGELFQQELYLPESPVVAIADQLTATTIVIGGIYDGDSRETYYRMDFIPDDDPALFGQILRNHLYFFTITEVLAPGWSGPDEAANNNSSDITAEVKEWDESTLYMAFDEANYFGISSRTIVVGHSEGASNSIGVDTNVDNYLLYWLDINGNIDTSIDPISLGETSDNGLFSVSINDSGTRIIATALTNLDPTVDSLTSRVRIEANRLRINIRIIQQRPKFIRQSLRIYNSTEEFTLGNNTLGTGTYPPSERTRPMVNIIKNTDNFGPTGTVNINGVSIAAQSQINFTRILPELFDVIYLTYNRDPNAATSGYILDWLDASDRRVLIVQYDLPNTSNGTILSLLGVPRFRSTNVDPFTFYDDAPAEIMNGLFGPVSQDLQIRCKDDIHGEILYEDAIANGITPILRGGSGGVVFGIDFTRRIVYSGDTDIYNRLAGNSGSTPSQSADTSGIISNEVDVFLANLWAWIAEVVLEEREE